MAAGQAAWTSGSKIWALQNSYALGLILIDDRYGANQASLVGK